MTRDAPSHFDGTKFPFSEVTFLAGQLGVLPRQWEDRLSTVVKANLPIEPGPVSCVVTLLTVI